MIIAAGLLLSACGSTASGTANDPASVGQAVTIDAHGVNVSVTLDKVVDPAPAACNQYGTCEDPPSGTRYVAVDLTVTNLAQTTFCFSPDPSVTGKDALGNSYQANGVINTPSGQWSGTGDSCAGPNTSLGAGKTSSGWAGFDMPTDASLKGAVFTVNRLNQDGTSFITVDGASVHWNL